MKMYDTDGEELSSSNFPVNGTFDFIGILSVDTVLAEFGSGDAMDLEDAFMSEFVAHNPPPSMVPRLHCVCFRSVAPQSPVLPCGNYQSPLTAGFASKATSKATSSSSLFPDTATESLSLVQRLQSTGSFETTRAWMVELLSTALGGDRLAGEYLLLNLISRVHTRLDATPLGGVSLGLCHLGTKDSKDVETAVNS